ncbi:hypothetical protein BHE74_00044870 [Ensete ventricosum]|nr:hypothetical protein BHE74_00044870 [Ensete ventricosum]
MQGCQKSLEHQEADDGRWDLLVANLEMRLTVAKDNGQKGQWHSGAAGVRFPRLRWLLPKLEDRDGHYYMGRSHYCELLECNVDHCIVSVLSPMAAQLKMTVGCGGCGIGDCGRARGVCRQRVVAMAEEEEGNPRPSRDDTSAARAKEEMEALVLGRQRATTKLTGEDGGAGARQPEGNSDDRGRSRQCYASRGQQ